MQTALGQSNVQIFSINAIASWQINAKSSAGTKVAMPALQRGYIWAAHQVEGLWDSLVRQLPVGAFLLTRYQEHLVRQKEIAGSHAEKPEFLLLDGQQRATALALAFADPWKDGVSSYPMALWVDLARPGSNYRDRAYMFRLVTRSHPWGYQRNDQRRLESKGRKIALDEFVKAIKRHKQLAEDAPLPEEAKYPGLSVAHAWPWDAICPLPFAILWEAAIGGPGWQDRLLSRLRAVPFWQSPMPTLHTPCWKKRLCELLEDQTGEEYERLCRLAEALPEVHRDTVIPGIVVPEHDMAQQLWELAAQRQNNAEETEQASETPPPDAVESLFVRINSAGTPLEGEELIYSTFKAIWPESQSLVEEIGKDAFIRPATLVALVGRLVLSIEQDKEAQRKRTKKVTDGAPERERSGIPPALNVTRFRSLVHASDGIFKKDLEDFILHKAKKLFAAAREFLAGTPDKDHHTLLSGKDDYRLGSLLTENLARSALDVYFFFLRWLNDNLDTPRREDVRKRILGALTGIAFFAPDPTTFVGRLWKRRSEAWWQGSFLSTEGSMRMKDDKLVMLPLPSPKELEESLQASLPSDDSKKGDWESWDWYNNLTIKYPKKSNSNYAIRCLELLGSQDAQEGIRHVDMVWAALWDKLWKERRLVLYAQRYWLDLFFPGYNPADPDQLEDSDRPFDWDHIIPQNYFFNIKRHIFNMWRKDWPQTIGNLRAWPMELNRGDGKVPPSDKLADTEVELLDARWKTLLPDGDVIREASFIGEKNWKKWKRCCGDDWAIINALTDKSDIGMALLSAITGRLCALYRYWYESLEVGSTLG